MRNSKSTVPPGKPSRGSLPQGKRGAPKGNLNALKHGFYAKAYSPFDRGDLIHMAWVRMKQALEDGMEEDEFDLSDELFMLKVFIRKAITEHEDCTAAEMAALVRSVAAAVNAITRISQIQFTRASAAPSQHELALQIALDEIRAELDMGEEEQVFDQEEQLEFSDD